MIRMIRLAVARRAAHKADLAYRNFMARTLADGWSWEMATIYQRARRVALDQYQRLVVE